MANSAHAQVTPAETRLDAVFGRPVVVPMRAVGRSIPDRVAIRLDDGRTIEGEVQWISATWPDEQAQSTWLGSLATLTAYAPRDPASGRGPGSWVMRMNYPLASAGQGFWLDGQRYEVNWMPDPLRLVGPNARDAWSSPLTAEEQSDPLLRTLVAAYEGHPLAGWRHDLAMGNLTPKPEFDPPEAGGAVDDLDALRAELLSPARMKPITQDLAAIERGRWQVALARMAETDAELAARVRTTLAGAVRTDLGALPIWLGSDRQLDELLDAVLDPQTSRDTRARRMKEWLDAIPSTASWVADDSGWQDGLTGELRPTVGVVNLSSGVVLAWARGVEATGGGDLSPLLPREMRYLRAEINPGTGMSGPRLGPGAEIQIGSTPRYLPVIGSVIPVAPPGFAIGPLRAEWTLDAWVGSDDQRDAGVPVSGLSAGMLFRGGPTDVGGVSAFVGPHESTGAWVVYVEARVPVGGPMLPEDRFELWFGPFGAATRVIHVYSDGRVTNGVTGADAPGFGVSVLRLADRWVARVPVPAYVIEDDGIVRLGAVRRDGFGMRSSWPRRLLPGQIEPGRVAVQTRAWDGFRGE